MGPAIEEMGGYVNAATTRDFTHVDVTVASQYLPQALELMSRAAFDVELTPAAVDRERQVVARELIDRLQGASAAVDDTLWETAFTAHPYRRPIGGTAESVTGLRTEQVQDFYGTLYVPGNMALLVVGDVDADAVIAQAGELFGGRPGARFARARPAPEPAQTEVRTAVRARTSDSTIVAFAWHTPGVSEFDDVCAMDLIYTLLGEGPLGRLLPALNEKGLALVSEVDFLTQRDPGLLTVTALGPPDQEVALRSAVLGEIRRLRDEPVTDQELTEAKRLLRIAYAFSNEAYADQTLSLGFYQALGNYRLAVDYIDRVEAVTRPTSSGSRAATCRWTPTRSLIIRPQQGQTQEVRLPCAARDGLG